MDAGVSTSLVHYHFASREALLAEALDYSYTHAGDVRIAARASRRRHVARRAPAIDDRAAACRPRRRCARTGSCGSSCGCGRSATRSSSRSPRSCTRACTPGSQTRSPPASQDGEFARCDPDEVADRALALIDGFGIRTLIGDGAIPLERARGGRSSRRSRSDLGLGEALAPPREEDQARDPAPSAARGRPRPVRTAPSM